MRWPSWWPWLPPSRKDVRAIVFGIILVAVVGTALAVWPSYRKDSRSAGFGPEWRCFYLPRSDPVCVKK
jgi:hypothetical protein